MTRQPDLRGGGRFDLTADLDRGLAIKRGDAAALDREARALRLVAGLGVAPRLRASRRGEIATELLTGRPRNLASVALPDLRTLGATLRRVHDSRRSHQGGRHVWNSRARSLDAYARRRIADARATGVAVEVADRVGDAFAGFPRTAERPFRLLHGDLTGRNIVWTPSPMLVDWEFWRIGDPAEDLAYLAEANGLSAARVATVLDGYDDHAVAARVPAWRPVCALDIGAWFVRAGDVATGSRLVARAARLAASAPGPARPGGR